MSKEYDPYMHTAEHVLNQTMVRLFGCGRSFSSHLNADKSKCDYHFPRPLEDAEAAEIERRVNEVLGRNLPVRTETLPRAEAGEKVDLGRLPAHLEGEEALMVRIVTVGDYDICPCIGEHVENTSQVGTFRLISHDFTPQQAGEASGRLRLRFKLKKTA